MAFAYYTVAYDRLGDNHLGGNWAILYNQLQRVLLFF
jgi:hypothetical protein